MESVIVRIRGLINDLTRSLSGAIVHIDDLYMVIDNKSDVFDDMCLSNVQISRSLELFLELRLDLLLLMESLPIKNTYINNIIDSIKYKDSHKINELLTVIIMCVDLLHTDDGINRYRMSKIYSDIKNYIINLLSLNMIEINIPRSGKLLKKESVNKLDSTCKLSKNKNAKILIIEDDEFVRNITSIVLNKKGYSVIECSTAKLAIDLFNKENSNYDLCLIDIGLPDMNGFQLAEKLMVIKKELKCLFVTGQDELIITEHNLSGKIFNYLIKPYKMGQLIAEVEKAL